MPLLSARYVRKLHSFAQFSTIKGGGSKGCTTAQQTWVRAAWCSELIADSRCIIIVCWSEIRQASLCKISQAFSFHLVRWNIFKTPHRCCDGISVKSQLIAIFTQVECDYSFPMQQQIFEAFRRVIIFSWTASRQPHFQFTRGYYLRDCIPCGMNRHTYNIEKVGFLRGYAPINCRKWVWHNLRHQKKNQLIDTCISDGIIFCRH